MVTPTRTLPRYQGGAALLIVMLLVLVAATTVLVSRLDVTDVRTRQQTDAQEALAYARAALIDYAATRPDFYPGDAVKLPCPDIDDSGGWLEGDAHTNDCGAVGETVIGRVPWRTLGIEPPRDSSGACLWYAVSGSYKDAGAATSPLINPDSNGQLQLFGIEATSIVAGSAPQDRPVAMLIAPMANLDGQVRAAAAGAGGKGRRSSRCSSCPTASSPARSAVAADSSPRSSRCCANRWNRDALSFHGPPARPSFRPNSSCSRQ